MEGEFGRSDDGQILASIGHALDALTDDRLRLPTDAEQLDLLQQGVRLGARIQAWQQQLAARIETSQAAWNQYRTSTRTWLAESMNLTGREATRLVKTGQGLQRFPIVKTAAWPAPCSPARPKRSVGFAVAGWCVADPTQRPRLHASTPDSPPDADQPTADRSWRSAADSARLAQPG